MWWMEGERPPSPANITATGYLIYIASVFGVLKLVAPNCWTATSIGAPLTNLLSITPYFMFIQL